MTSRSLYTALFSVITLSVAVLIWYRLVPNYEWHIVQQFWGHLGPAIFLVALGVSAIFLRNRIGRMVRIEAWLAIVAGLAYVLADTFIMHPPWGIFDGSGKAEEEHVMLMSLFVALGVSALVLQNRLGENFNPAIQFVIAGAAAYLVFSNHHQHSVAGTVGHNATLVMVAVAIGFRLMQRMMEYSIAMIVTGFVFFSSQMGFAMYVDMAGNSASAWVAGWVAAGFLVATIYVALGPPERPEPAE